VFSVSTVFSHLLRHPGFHPDEAAPLSLFADLLPVDRHGERFLFMDNGATYADVKHAFEEPPERGRRLAAVFLTETGDASQRLLGMATPWDVLGVRGRE